MKKIDVLIIGAGAAGLMCAIEAGKRGRSVLVVDHANKAGKKILMSGGGRCNFTNLEVGRENFISHNPHFCQSALKGYSPWDFIAMVQRHQVPYHEKKLGQLFCDNKSKDIVTLLLAECEAAGVVISLSTIVQSVSREGAQQFIIKTTQGDYRALSCVVATGGLSIPTMGASPFGYRLATQFGIKVWPTRAGLVPFTLQAQDKNKLSTLSGIAVDCSVACRGQIFSEALLFTHRGLSGPAMLQISSYWEPGDAITINLCPSIDMGSRLISEKNNNPNQCLKNVLSALFSKRQVGIWLSECDLNSPLQSFSNDRLQGIAKEFQQWVIKPNGTEGYRTAEVTLGGVDCNAISSKTFEAVDTMGLYFIGEVLDVTGWLGGYNFQWAWASGFAAGQVV